MLTETALQSHGFGAAGLALGGGGGAPLVVGGAALTGGGGAPLVVGGGALTGGGGGGGAPLFVGGGALTGGGGAPLLVVGLGAAPSTIKINEINNNIATNNLFIFPQKNNFFF
jgi:hypothetical protein